MVETSNDFLACRQNKTGESGFSWRPMAAAFSMAGDGGTTVVAKKLDRKTKTKILNKREETCKMAAMTWWEKEDDQKP